MKIICDHSLNGYERGISCGYILPSHTDMWFCDTLVPRMELAKPRNTILTIYRLLRYFLPYEGESQRKTVVINVDT